MTNAIPEKRTFRADWIKVLCPRGTASYVYDANGNMTSRAGQSITWYSFDKPNRIDHQFGHTEFKYGPDRSRFKQTNVTSGVTTTTHYVGGHFQKVTKGSATEYQHHVVAYGNVVAIHTRPVGGTNSTRYVHRDHLGSISAISKADGTLDQEYSFDVFGKRRNADWTNDPGDSRYGDSHATERGYTGHESLDSARLTHMNGRVQDPILGRMVSSDPFVPDPADLQSFNKYSYVRNNPLSLVDPSGFCHESVPHDPDDGSCEADFQDLLAGLVATVPRGAFDQIADRDIDALDSLEAKREEWECAAGLVACSSGDFEPREAGPSDYPRQLGDGLSQTGDPFGTIFDLLIPSAHAQSVSGRAGLLGQLRELAANSAAMLVRDPTDKLTVQYNPAQLGLIAAHLNKVALAQGDSFLTSPYFGPERAMMFRMLAGRGDQHTAAFFHHEIAEVIATTNLGGDRLSPGRAFLQTQAQAHYDVIRAQGHSTLPRQGLFLRYHPAVVLAFPDFFN